MLVLQNSVLRSSPSVIVLCLKRCEELVCLRAKGLTVSQRCHQSAIIIGLLSPKSRGSCHDRVLTVCRHLKGNLNLFLAWETASIMFKGSMRYLKLEFNRE